MPRQLRGLGDHAEPQRICFAVGGGGVARINSAVAALSAAKPPRRPADGAIADLDRCVL